ncbi:hypothetical protein D3C81_1651180 [compost metagenome]
MQRLQQGALGGRQTKIGAIPAGKAGIVDRHLLAFDIAGQPADKHHHVRTAGGIECLLEG